MSDFGLKVSKSGLEPTPVFFGQGMLSVVDQVDHQAEYHFGVKVIAKSEEAFNQFLDEIQSEHFPQMRWYLDQLHLKGRGTNEEDWIAMDDDVLFPDIVSATIIRLPKAIGFEVLGVTVAAGNPEEILVEHPGLFNLWIEAQEGKVSVSIGNKPLITVSDDDDPPLIFAGKYQNHVTMLVKNKKLLDSKINYFPEVVDS